MADLQAVFTRAYDECPTESLDYTKAPNPPLTDDNALWATNVTNV